jgi:YggT family protein
MLRFFLDLAGNKDRFNPITLFLFNISEPVLRPMRLILPRYGTLDMSALVLIYLLNLAYLHLIYLIMGRALFLPALLSYGLVDMALMVANLYTFSLIAQAVLSWINPPYHPATAMLYQLNAPLLNRAHQILPPISGLDLSPILLLILLQFIKILISGYGSAL